MIKHVVSFLFPPKPGQSEDRPIEIDVVPGLTTFLDVALFRANEAQLTATTCSSHALLACWLDVKHQSQQVLQTLMEHEENDSNARLACESLSRQCLESSMDAIERLSTDKLSQTANLSDPYESISATAGAGGHHQMLSGVGAQGIASGIMDSKSEIGRRYPLQKPLDCWESPRLHCPDYVWADDAYQACQRWIRNLTKHPFYLRENDAFVPIAGSQNHSHHSSHSNFSNNDPLHPASERQASVLIQLIHEDLPMRLHHFRQAMHAEEVVTQRLYLVKCEYRAPFRHFLEAHQSLLRAPSMELVDHYLANPSPNAESLKSQLQSLLKTPEVVELFALEKECEEIELEMGEALFPFSELARTLDHKKARLKVVPGTVEEDELAGLQETVRRLKCILCRKGGSETSTGIRPILMDLQSVPRDDEVKGLNRRTGSLEDEIAHFLAQLECLSMLIKTKNAFQTKKGAQDIDFSASVVKGCTEQFDMELLKCQLLDWFAIVKRQHELKETRKNIPDLIQKAEMKMSIAGANEKSLNLVKDRLKLMTSDRQQRLEIVTEMIEEICLREMNLYVRLKGPDPDKRLVLRETSAVGFLGIPLQLAGEPLPVG
eukprot:scaffold154_cov129-Cylindrotheca_fusiformis.AAC.19